ncbi:MAG: ATP-binding protein, partial [Siculibacillus sp.]|nr:ATP-binding protein [Siculibacillus sp.]
AVAEIEARAAELEPRSKLPATALDATAEAIDAVNATSVAPSPANDRPIEPDAAPGEAPAATPLVDAAAFAKAEMPGSLGEEELRPTDAPPTPPVEMRSEAPPAAPVEPARIVALAAAPRPTADAERLSPPERVAFRQIAEALGARMEGEERLATPPPGGDASREAAPASAEPSPAPLAATTTARDVRLLDRLPSAVAVVKDDNLIYGNEAFLRLLAYPDLATLEAEGGLDALFAGEHVARRWKAGPDGSRPVPVLTREGRVVPVDAQVATVPWGTGSALMLTLTEVEAPPREEPSEANPTEAAAPIAALAAARPAEEPAPIPAVAPPPAPAAPAAPEAVTAAGLSDAGLRERVGELEAIIDTATDGVLLLDAEGTILSANHAAEALFGTDRVDMIGRPLADRLAPESRRSAMDYLDGLARNGVASVLNDGREVIGVVERGGLIPLFMTIGRISAAPARKYCAVLRDITHWKKSEEDLTAARRRAEEASVHKSDFLAKISHEIRTPLNAIIGFSEVMIDERFGPIGSERYKDYLRDIHSSGSHIMSLINDLLDLSKVEAGKMDLRFEAVALGDIMAECVAMMQPQANRERIIIRSSLPAGVPAVVADPRSVRQVMLNLLSNAIKFTPSGGQVIVSSTLEDSGEVVMRVRDTGYGMTEKELQTAMEPFRQLHTTRSRGGGTGLGLPLTKALVEANRAVLRIDSTVGQGTLVTVTFPVTRVLAS